MGLKINNRFFGAFLSFLLLISGQGEAVEKLFHGASDVSAAVFLDQTRFVVADDETNILRIYDVNIPESPIFSLDLNAFLEVEGKFPEADIEAAARMDDRIYWITSHGRNSGGKTRSNRHRFFCTKLNIVNDQPQLEPVGRPCTDLIRQFPTQSSLVYNTITKAARPDGSLSKKEREKMAPKKEGLNIEGLVYYRPNKSLLIGLRNPLFSPDGKKGGNAIVVELLNPQAVVDDGADARFGRVLGWNLNNRGIRGMEYSDCQKAFFILAGAVDSETTFALYRWDGDFAHQPELATVWPKEDSFNPEGIAESHFGGPLWIFSDDGTLEISIDSPSQCQEGELLGNGRCPNKYLTEDSCKTFRIRQITPNGLKRQ